jgi:hypothetical protein
MLPPFLAAFMKEQKFALVALCLMIRFGFYMIHEILLTIPAAPPPAFFSAAFLALFLN